MIICPSCNYQNPDGALQCEQCFTPLPATINCPNCGASVQADATFCGQCGFNIPEPVASPKPLIPSTMMSMPGGEVAKAQPQTEEPEATNLPKIPLPSMVTNPTPEVTRLQTEIASIFHVQTNTRLELPQGISVIHLGKPNDRIPPDVDVSGFPDSDVVSRVHADIRVEGDIYYIEDTGSANGTYVNHIPLVRSNRHRLRPGDRIALGKGDKVTFIFQMS